MSNVTYHKDNTGTQRWFENGKLARVREPDGRERVYAYKPKAHLEYVRFRNGEEWFSHDGLSARPD